MSRLQCFIFLKKSKGHLKMVNEKWKVMKDGQISLYCHFNKIMKEPVELVSSLQSKTC